MDQEDSGPTPSSMGGGSFRVIGADEAARLGHVGAAEGAGSPGNESRREPRPTLRFPLSGEPDRSTAEGINMSADGPEDGDTRRSLFSVGSSTPDPPATAPEPLVAPPLAAVPDDDDEYEYVYEDDEGVGEAVDDDDYEWVDEEEEESAETSAVPDATEELRIPHWTEDATGEHQVTGSGGDPAWRTFAESGPRWREDGSDFDARDDVALLGDESTRKGVLDPDAVSESELISFNDLDAETAERRQQKPSPAKSSARDRGVAGNPAELKKVSTSPNRAPRTPSARGGGPPKGEDRDITQAAAVGVGLAGLILILLKIGPAAAMLMVLALVALCAAEFFLTVRRAKYEPAQLLGIAGCLALPLAAYNYGLDAYPIVLGLVVMAGFVWYVVEAGEGKATLNMGITLLGVMWIGFLPSFGGLLLSAPDGPSLLLATLLVAVSHDVVAFFAGRQFGQAPLTPVSPGKTVEGFAGGIAGGVVMSLIVLKGLGLAENSFGETMATAFAFGLVVSLATAIGDLCESVVKRDLGVKDMGTLLPGHGGVLDRMDGILFALPAAFYVYYALL